jgi:hypothetical protein
VTRLSALALLLALSMTGPTAATEGSSMPADQESRLRTLADALPAELHGWRKADAEVYGPDTLWRYINGGAELYLAYRFAILLSVPYLDPDGDEMRLDVFDMGSPGSAFGVFCHSREAVDRFVAPDVDSEYSSGLLHFWKGRYYASMLAYPETETRRAVVRDVAQTLAAGIDGTCEPPDLIGLLTVAGLVPASVRYFRHPAWINDYHRLDDENLLAIEADTEVAMARVRIPSLETPAVRLIVRYPDASRAETAERRFRQARLADASDGLIQEEHGWLGCRREGDLVIVVAAAPDREAAASLLQIENQETGRPR